MSVRMRELFQSARGIGTRSRARPTDELRLSRRSYDPQVRCRRVAGRAPPPAARVQREGRRIARLAAVHGSPSRRARTPRAGSVRRRRPRSPNILRTRTVGNGDGEAALHVRRFSSLLDRNVAQRPVDGPPAVVVFRVTVPAGDPEPSREGAGASRAHTDSVMVDTPIGPARIIAGREGGAPTGGLEAMKAETDRKDTGALPSSSPGSARHRCAARLRTEAWRQECRTGCLHVSDYLRGVGLLLQPAYSAATETPGTGSPRMRPTLATPVG